jgi:hypothetical protein
VSSAKKVGFAANMHEQTFRNAHVALSRVSIRQAARRSPGEGQNPKAHNLYCFESGLNSAIDSHGVNHADTTFAIAPMRLVSDEDHRRLDLSRLLFWALPQQSAGNPCPLLLSLLMTTML